MYQRLCKLSFGIHNIDDLREHLQVAIELEHATIPPYLCALYSIPDGKNPKVVQLIRSVIMDEMLHITLASNVLNAIGGAPVLNKSDFIPSYPTQLPHSKGNFCVHLERFCPSSIDTFRKIERPAKPSAPPQADNYETIGQFYEAIEDGLKRICKGNHHFISDHSKQVTPELYYGGSGHIVVVTDLESALKALEVIVAQGEGLHHTIFDGDDLVFDDDRDLAHYFRFNEIYLGKRYTCHDKPHSQPSGEEFAVDWESSYRMRRDPKTDDYPTGSELWQKSDDFNRRYTSLLNTLHQVYNGEPQKLMEAVGQMYDLKYQAIELMRIPFGENGETAGPSFEFQGEHIMSKPLPSIPKGFQMPFYYSSLTNYAVFYRVDPSRIYHYLENKGVKPVLFDGQGVVSFNYQLYTAQFSWGASTTSEIELNILVYPTSEADKVPEVSFEEFILGNEQTKTMGHLRVHVPCDNKNAIEAGIELFDEPKFKTTFATKLPSLNDPSSKMWQFTCNDPEYPASNDPANHESEEHCIFSCEADLKNLDAIAGNCSPITVYGFVKDKLIAARWNILQPFTTYFLSGDEQKRIKINYGKSTHSMQKDLKSLIGNSPAAAVQTFQSPPIAIQSRAYYI